MAEKAMLLSTPEMRLLAACVRSRTPLIIEGEPGETKTAKIIKHAYAWNLYPEVLVGSSRDKGDYLGLAKEEEYMGVDTVRYSAPGYAIRCNKAPEMGKDYVGALLILDEFSNNDPEIKAPNLRLVQERYAGDTKLEDHVSIVAIQNPTHLSANGFDLTAPESNRFVHMKWRFDADEWLDNVLTDFKNEKVFSLDQLLGKGSEADHARARGLVTAYLRANRTNLKPGAPKNEADQAKPWASPRSWTNLMKVLGELHPSDEGAMLLALKGTVGDAYAAEFVAFMNTGDLHDPVDVLKDPAIVDWRGERPDRLFATLNSVAALALSRGDKATWEQAMDVFTYSADNGRKDTALPAVRMLFNAMPQGATIRTKTEQAFADIFRKSGRFAA